MWPWQMSGIPMSKSVMGNSLAVSILLSSLDECPGPLRGFEGIVWDSIQHEGGHSSPQCRQRGPHSACDHPIEDCLVSPPER